MKSKKLLMLNLSGVYEQSELYGTEDLEIICLKDIEGTNCYCDPDAEQEISRRLSEFSPRGIHLIDSGNYHYISKLWIEKISRPFTLIMLDNHTDMQPSAFGEILSCGGWLQTSLRHLKTLEKVFLIGPDQESFDETEFSMDERVIFFSKEMLSRDRDELWMDHIIQEIDQQEIYLSIDKDVLHTDFARTSWSQGNMTLKTLIKFLEKLCSRSIKLIGADICGEDEAGSPDQKINEDSNREILNILKRCDFEE